MNNYNQFKTTVLQPPIESKQYVSVVYNQRLSQHGITASTGIVGGYDTDMTIPWLKTWTALTKMS